jgi:anti-sigma factor RsiW
MTDHLTFERLSDLADGTLTGAAEASARAHVRGCDECASRLAAVSALAASAAALPREIVPPEDLWRDIRRKLETRPAGGLRAWRIRHLAAAAVIIAVASSAMTLFIVSDRAGPVTPEVASVPETRPAAPELPILLASAEDGYARSVASLQRTLADKKDQLAPSTIAVVERSLRIADSAIAEARDALARDPSNRALAALFSSNYERKIDLLRRATELAPRT